MGAEPTPREAGSHAEGPGRGQRLFRAQSLAPSDADVPEEGISANQATAVWGLLSLANSYVIYLAIVGKVLLVAVVFALYFVVVVIDCVDGEIARYRNTASPIGGKLLDGVWHKATEFSLLVAYVAGVYHLSASPWLCQSAWCSSPAKRCTRTSTSGA